MLPPENDVLLARQCFADAQSAMIGAKSVLGFYTIGWYGTELSDERGSFAVVNASGPLTYNVGDYLNVTYNRRSVAVYVIGSQTNLLSDIALTRRSFLAIGLLADEPVRGKVESIQ